MVGDTQQTQGQASGAQPSIDLRALDAGATGATSQAQAQAGAQVSSTQAAVGTQSTTASDDQSLFSKFDIPDAVRKQYPELIPLILQTESMNDDERQYWFQILPIMTDEQVGKLREILANEKQQLAALDKEYNQELKQINEKHVTEWKEFETKEKREKLKAAEANEAQVNSQEQNALLNTLQNL